MLKVTSIRWEANAGDFSPDGKWLTYTINEDGRTDAYLAKANGTDAHKLADVVTSDIGSLSGVVRTQTMVAFAAYSRHDLEALFSIGE